MNRLAYYTIPLLLFLVLVIVTPVSAQTASPVQASLSVEGQNYQVGDRIQVALIVTHPNDHQVISPQIDETWGNFTVVSQSPLETSRNNDGFAITRQLIDVRLFAPGSYTTPPLAVRVSDSTGNLAEVIAPPATVTIKSVLVEGDSQLRDIKPQAELPYTNWLPWFIFGGLFALGFSALMLIWQRKNARQAMTAADTRLPHEVALDELERIAGLRLHENGRFKEHYTLVIDTLRIYIENAFHIQIMDRTTSEVPEVLKQIDLATDFVQELIFLLQESDLVKFAKFTPDVREAKDFLERSRLFVQATKPAPIDTDPSTGDADKSGHANRAPERSNQRTRARSELTV